MKLSDEEVIKTRNDLEMMRRPHLWPGGARVLHLKLLDVASHTYRAFALLSHTRGGDFVFTPKMKMDAFSEPNFSKSEVGGDALLKKLDAVGWIVD
jgi:hypothetical protein